MNALKKGCVRKQMRYYVGKSVSAIGGWAHVTSFSHSLVIGKMAASSNASKIRCKALNSARGTNILDSEDSDQLQNLIID